MVDMLIHAIQRVKGVQRAYRMKNYIGKIKNSGQQYVKAPYAEVSKGKTKATVSNKDLRDGKR